MLWANQRKTILRRWCGWNSETIAACRTCHKSWSAMAFCSWIPVTLRQTIQIRCVIMDHPGILFTTLKLTLIRRHVPLNRSLMMIFSRWSSPAAQWSHPRHHTSRIPPWNGPVQSPMLKKSCWQEKRFCVSDAELAWVMTKWMCRVSRMTLSTSITQLLRRMTAPRILATLYSCPASSTRTLIKTFKNLLISKRITKILVIFHRTTWASFLNHPWKKLRKHQKILGGPMTWGPFWIMSLEPLRNRRAPSYRGEDRIEDSIQQFVHRFQNLKS